jgi:hypothetical protein
MHKQTQLTKTTVNATTSLAASVRRLLLLIF